MEMNSVTIAVVYLVGITLLLIVNEVNYRKWNVKVEMSRKVAHFLSALSTLTFPYIFSSHWYVLVMASIFFLVLLLTQKGSLLKSIHGIERKSVGSYLLPLAIYVTFYLFEVTGNKLVYILPMLILAVSDPMAAIVGISVEKYNHRIVIFGIDTKKSTFGSLAFFTSSFVISLAAIYFSRGVFDVQTYLIAFSVAIVGTASELVGLRGYDNITIPISVVCVLMIFI